MTATRSSANKLVPISQPMPDVTELPDKGFPWQQEMAVDLKCVTGTDAGTEVVFKTNTEGGKGEVIRLIEAVRDRSTAASTTARSRRSCDSKTPPTRISSTARPGSRVLTVADWMSLDGPAPVPAPASPPPRRATASPARRLTPMRT